VNGGQERLGEALGAVARGEAAQVTGDVQDPAAVGQQCANDASLDPTGLLLVRADGRDDHAGEVAADRVEVILGPVEPDPVDASSGRRPDGSPQSPVPGREHQQRVRYGFVAEPGVDQLQLRRQLVSADSARARVHGETHLQRSRHRFAGQGTRSHRRQEPGRVSS
jgi:hypothetical protein